MKNLIPYQYNFFGSEDSIDKDVFILVDSLPESDIREQELRKELASKIKKEIRSLGFDWNISLIVVKDGIVVDNVYPVGSIDSLNNSLFKTYSNHKQDYSCFVNRMVDRNKPLAIYKTVRQIMTTCSRTEFRPFIKPNLKGLHDFDAKLNALLEIDFTKIETFNQPNEDDLSCWKIIVFYLLQNMLLLQNIEVYSKSEILNFYPEFKNFILRNPLTISDKRRLTKTLSDYIYRIKMIPYSQNGYDFKKLGKNINLQKER